MTTRCSTRLPRSTLLPLPLPLPVTHTPWHGGRASRLLLLRRRPCPPRRRPAAPPLIACPPSQSGARGPSGLPGPPALPLPLPPPRSSGGRRSSSCPRGPTPPRPLRSRRHPEAAAAAAAASAAVARLWLGVPVRTAARALLPVLGTRRATSLWSWPQQQGAAGQRTRSGCVWSPRRLGCGCGRSYGAR